MLGFLIAFFNKWSAFLAFFGVGVSRCFHGEHYGGLV